MRDFFCSLMAGFLIPTIPKQPTNDNHKHIVLLWSTLVKRKKRIENEKSKQHPCNPYQCHYHSNNRRHGRYLPEQENAQDDSSRHFLRGNQISIGRVHPSYRSIIECMPQTQREDPKGNYGAYCTQGIRMLKRKRQCDGEEPERCQPVT